MKALIDIHLKVLQSTKVIMMFWVRWLKPVKSTITLNLGDLGCVGDLESRGDVYTKFEEDYLTAS